MAAEPSATSLATQNANTQTGGQGKAAPTTGTGTMRAAIVSLGGEQFTIDLQNVREVFVVESITPVPGMPAGLVGVTNLRGSVVPLLDLRQMIGLAAQCRTRSGIAFMPRNTIESIHSSRGAAISIVFQRASSAGRAI